MLERKRECGLKPGVRMLERKRECGLKPGQPARAARATWTVPMWIAITDRITRSHASDVGGEDAQ
jgi:hypothetical protein